MLLAPAGVVACFRPLTDASLFLLLYGVTAVYFSGVMVSRPLFGWIYLNEPRCTCILFKDSKYTSCFRPVQDATAPILTSKP